MDIGKSRRARPVWGCNDFGSFKLAGEGKYPKTFHEASAMHREKPVVQFVRYAWVLLFASLCSGQDSRYERLMKDVLIFDAHIDTPRLFIDEAYRLTDRHA